MISDRYEQRLFILLDQTKKFNIKWRPISEYIRTHIEPYYSNVNSSGLAQHIQEITDKFHELYYNKSFFVQNNGYILALLNYKIIPEEGGNTHEILELVGEINQSSLIRIPEYIKGGFINLQREVIKYWDFKEGDYNIDYSDSFELLEVVSDYNNTKKVDCYKSGL